MQRFDEILQPDGLFAIAIPLRSAQWNFGDGYTFAQVAASARAIILLEELHRVAAIHVLHPATGLPRSTIVRLVKSLYRLSSSRNPS